RLSAGARARGPWLAGPSPDVDHIDEALCQGWSVLVRGTAAPRRAPGGAALPAGGRRGLAVARRRGRSLRAARAPRDHRPPHRVAAGSLSTEHGTAPRT